MNNLTIKIAGVPDLLLTPDVIEVVVDTNVFLPGMFTILIQDHLDPTLGVLTHGDNALKYGIGTPIEIKIETDDGSILPPSNTVISGEITSVEPVFRDDGQVFLKIRGYDRSHRLTYGKVTRTFGDGNPSLATVTDNLIVAAVAAKYGLVPSIQSTGVRYNYVMQYNQSDWDFLQSRAEQLGYQMYVDGRTLHFEDATKTRYSKSAEKLVWGRNLSKFEPRLATAGTVSKVEAYGWDPDAKKTVKGAKSNGKSQFVKILETKLSSSATHKLKLQIDPEEVIIDSEIQSSGQANKVAAARLEALESQYVRASGELPNGDPRLLAGTEVEIDGVGKRFSGKYYVTEAKHIWRHGNYSVRFEVSGRNPHTLRSILRAKDSHVVAGMPGVAVGVVTSLNDPEKLGRVKVKFPWMPAFSGSEMESQWARVASIGAGNDRGVFFLPEINDEVLVSFEGGDINNPFVVGMLWNKKDKPPKGKLGPGGSKVEERVIRSRSGHTIVLDDSTGAEKITITDKTEKNSIEIDSKTNAMTFKTAGDFTIDAGGKFTVKSNMDMTLDSKGKGGFKAISGMELDCAGGAKVKAGGSSLDLTAATAALKSTKVDVQANAQASVKGSAMVEIQGGLVKIN